MPKIAANRGNFGDFSGILLVRHHVRFYANARKVYGYFGHMCGATYFAWRVRSNICAAQSKYEWHKTHM
jgi:hypothetical protein